MAEDIINPNERLQEVIESAKKLSIICDSIQSLIPMVYNYEDGTCPACLMESVFGDAQALSEHIYTYLAHQALPPEYKVIRT